MRIEPRMNRVLIRNVDVKRVDSSIYCNCPNWMNLETVCVVIAAKARVLEQTAKEPGDGYLGVDGLVEERDEGFSVLQLTRDVRFQLLGAEAKMKVAIASGWLVLAIVGRQVCGPRSSVQIKRL